MTRMLSTRCPWGGGGSGTSYPYYLDSSSLLPSSSSSAGGNVADSNDQGKHGGSAIVNAGPLLLSDGRDGGAVELPTLSPQGDNHVFILVVPPMTTSTTPPLLFDPRAPLRPLLSSSSSSSDPTDVVALLITHAQEWKTKSPAHRQQSQCTSSLHLLLRAPLTKSGGGRRTEARLRPRLSSNNALASNASGHQRQRQQQASTMTMTSTMTKA